MPPHQSMACRWAACAPEVVIVDGVEVGVHRNHAGARGIEREPRDGVTIHAGIFEGAPGGGGQRGHVVGVAWRGVVRVLLFAQQRVRSRAGAKTALDGVEDGNANAEGAEIYSGDNAHVRDLLEEGKLKHAPPMQVVCPQWWGML